MVYSKNIISEPSWREVVVHSPHFFLSAAALRNLRIINKACVIIIQAVSGHSCSPHVPSLAVVYLEI